MIRKYEGEIPKRYFEDCLKFMDISKYEAKKIIDNARPDHLWKNIKNKWARLQDLPELSI